MQHRIRHGITKGVALEEDMSKEEQENTKDREGGARGTEREGRGRMEETQSTKKRDLTIVYNEWSNSKGFANRVEWVCATEAIT